MERKKNTKSIKESTESKETKIVNKEEKEIKEEKKSRQFTKRDLTKEFKYTPTDFIDDENPLTFVFTLLSNSEQALLNDKLQCLQAASVVQTRNYKGNLPRTRFPTSWLSDKSV